jgi:RNA polymerase sigma-70 factor (ECF subfamily)
VRAGDAAAFELIMRRHNQRLFRLARSVLRNAVEAEDVVQETYVRAFAKLDDFKGPGGFPAWLARIAYNEGSVAYRGHRMRVRERRPSGLDQTVDAQRRGGTDH